jgi:seryl-tRNA(Sec) selenium transferase
MDFFKKYDLTQVINAAGTYTPLGVSRSAPAIGDHVAEALGNFLIIDELQDAASRSISAWTGAQAGAVTHCVASAITLSVAVAMAGSDDRYIAVLPDASQLSNKVVIPAGHAINYVTP